jgi:hypothetical protein
LIQANENINERLWHDLCFTFTDKEGSVWMMFGFGVDTFLNPGNNQVAPLTQGGQSSLGCKQATGVEFASLLNDPLSQASIAQNLAVHSEQSMAANTGLLPEGPLSEGGKLPNNISLESLDFLQPIKASLPVHDTAQVSVDKPDDIDVPLPSAGLIPQTVSGQVHADRSEIGAESSSATLKPQPLDARGIKVEQELSGRDTFISPMERMNKISSREKISQKSQSEIVQFLTGDLQQIPANRIPDIVLRSDFIQSAVAQESVANFMHQPMKVEDLSRQLDLPALPTKELSAYDFLKEHGVDADRVITELELLKDNLAVDGVESYVARAQSLKAASLHQPFASSEITRPAHMNSSDIPSAKLEHSPLEKVIKNSIPSMAKVGENPTRVVDSPVSNIEFGNNASSSPVRAENNLLEDLVRFALEKAPKAERLEQLKPGVDAKSITSDFATASAMTPALESSMNVAMGSDTSSSHQHKDQPFTIAENIRENIESLTQDLGSKSHAEFTIQSAEHGPIQIKLEVEDQIVDLQIGHESEKLRQAFELEIPKLKDALSQQNLSMGSFSWQQQSSEQRNQHHEDLAALNTTSTKMASLGMKQRMANLFTQSMPRHNGQIQLMV